MSETQAPYRRKQNKFDIAEAITAGAEIEQQYRRAAEILISAILREPHTFGKCAQLMHPAWWANTKFDKCAGMIFQQFAGPNKQFSAYSVASNEVGEDYLISIQSANADTPLELALDVFTQTYRVWVEYKASEIMQSAISRGADADEVRRLADEFRAKSRQYIEIPDTDTESLENWANLKMDGYEFDYPCKPNLLALRTERYLTSYEPGCLYIIAARPSMGKTHYAIGDLLNFEREGARGVFFSADMDTLKFQQRIVGILTGYDTNKDWSMFDRSKIKEAVDFVKKMKCKIVGSVTDLGRAQTIISAEAAGGKLDYVIFDYLQLFKTQDTGKGRYEITTAVSIELKRLSKVFSIPVIALSQLSRISEGTASKRPTLASLRDSGAIEENASMVAFLHRPEYYGIMQDEEGLNTAGTGEVIIAKSQTGATGTVIAAFNGITGWSDLSAEPAMPTTLPQTNFSAHRPTNEADIPF